MPQDSKLINDYVWCGREDLNLHTLSQYRLTIGNEDFFIDLLFYHLKLRAFVVVDLKMKAFEPEFAGKMNFYLSTVNDLLRSAT
jgi:hypothetical protein